MKTIFLTVILISLSACKVDVGTDESKQFKIVPLTADANFEQLKTYIMSPSCISCHAWAANEAEVQQRISFGKPEDSILFQRMKSGSMPPSGALSGRHLKLVENYIKNAKEVETIPVEPTYKSMEFHLIKKSCLSCHHNDGDEMSFEGYENTAKRAKRILGILDDGDMAVFPMPPYDDKGNRTAPAPTNEVIEAFRQWIKEGKKNN